MSQPNSIAVSTQDKGLPQFPANLAVDTRHSWLGGPSGSSYMTPPQRRKIKEYCLKRDGYKCLHCLLPEDNVGELVVHHVDRIVSNKYSDNVQLMHWDCNNDARWGKPSRRLQSMLSTPTPINIDTQLVRREMIEDPSITVAQRTNLENEVEFRRACFKATLDMMDPAVVDGEKFIGRRGMMSYSMEKSGSSQDASYGYMRKLFAPRIGPLIEEIEIGSKLRTVKLRDPKDYKLTLEQLEAKYPKEGQCYSH